MFDNPPDFSWTTVKSLALFGGSDVLAGIRKISIFLKIFIFTNSYSIHDIFGSGYPYYTPTEPIAKGPVIDVQLKLSNRKSCRQFKFLEPIPLKPN